MAVYAIASVRCDVASSVGILCRHAASYGEEHIKAAKRIIRYLYATRTFGLVYRGDNIPGFCSGSSSER